MLLVFDLDDTLYGCTGQMKEATKWEDAKHIVPFPGVIELLSSFPAEKILLSRETDAGLQDIKIDALRIGFARRDPFKTRHENRVPF